jgi:hypothetical protein
LLKLLGTAAFGLALLSCYLVPVAALGLGLGGFVLTLARRDLAEMAAGLRDPDGQLATERAAEAGRGAIAVSLFAAVMWALHFLTYFFR